LTSLINVLNNDSQNWLQIISQQATTIGGLGDGFKNLDVSLGADVDVDLGTFAADQATAILGIFADIPTSASLGPTIVETVAPGVVDNTVSLLAALNDSQPGACNPANLIDSGWLSDLMSGASPQIAAQGAVARDQGLMAVLWLESQGQSPNINSLSGSAIASAVQGIYSSPNGLTDTGDFLDCNIASIQSQLATNTMAMLNNPPQMSAQLQTTWVGDLAARARVPLVYGDLITWNSDFLQEINAANQSYATSALIAESLQNFASGWALCLDALDDNGLASEFASTFDDGINNFVDNARLDFFEQQVQASFNGVALAADYSGRVALNEVAAVAEMQNMEHFLKPPPDKSPA
jgi:hypothetical protein